MNTEAAKTIDQLRKKINRLNDTILDLENSAGNDRLVAEQNLQKSETRYSAIISGLVWAIAIHVNNRIVYVNDALKKLVGIEDEEKIIGRNVLEFVHPEDQEKVVNAIQFAHADPNSGSGNNPKIIEERLIRSDGSQRIVEASAILLDYDGEKAVAVTLNDITDRKLAEKAVKRGEQKYRIIAENTHDVISLHSFNLKFSLDYISPSVKTLSGYTPEELLGKSVFGFMYADDKKSLINELKQYIGYKLKKMLTGHNIPLSKTFDFRIKHKSGNWLFAQSTVSIVGNQIVAITRDITAAKKAEQALRQSEEKYRAIFEEAMDGLIVVDENSIAREVNPSFTKITGIQKKDIVGKSGYDIAKKFISIKQLPQLLVAIQNMLLGKPIKSFEISYKGKFFELSTNKQENGEIIGIVHNTTERKLAEKKIKESQEHYRDLVEKSGIAIAIDNREGKIVYHNEKFQELFGYSAKELKNHSIQSLVHPDDLSKIMHIHSNRLQNNRIPSRYEFKGIRKDGTIIFLEVNAVDLRENGHIIGTRSYIWDISTQKNAEKVLKESQQRYKRLFNDSPISLWEEDYSDVKAYLDLAKSKGITDFVEYFDKHPNEIINCLHKVKVLDLNKAAMGIHHVKDKEILITNRINTFNKYSLDTFKKMLITIAEGRKQFESETKITTLNNEIRDIQLKYLLWEEKKQDTAHTHAIVAINDITDRKKTEQSLKESEERYNLALKATNEGIYDWNLQSNEIYYSPTWKNLLGYEDEELPNDLKEWESLTSAEDFKKSRQMLNELINKKRPFFELEFKMKHKNGHWVDIRSRANAFFNQKGKAIRVVGTHVDITERKKQQQALKNSEYFLRKSQEIASTGSYKLDIKQGIWESTTVLDKIFGLKKQDEKNFEDWVNILHPEDREMMIEYFSKDVLSNHSPFDKEYRIQRKNDNQERWVHGLGKLEFDKDGTLISMYGTIQDITARKRSEKALKESEQKFRDLANLLPLVVYEIDTSGKLVYLNNQGFETFGYTPKDLERGLNVLDSIAPEDREKAKNSIQNRILSRRVGGVEYTAQRKDGTRFPIVIYASVILLEGKVVGLRGVIMDNTLQKEAKDALKKSEQQYRDFFEKDISGSFLSNPQGKLINCNPAFSKMLGYTSTEIMEIDTVQLYPNPSARNEFIKRLTKNKNLLNLEIDLIRKDGQLINCVENVVGSFNSNGELIKFQGYIVDITDRKKAENALRESEEKYRSLFATANDAIFVMKNDIFIACNQKTLEIFGCREDEIVGYSPAMYSPEYQPDGTLSKEKADLKIKNALSGDPQFFEWTHRRKNGTPFSAEVSLNRMLLSDGEYIHAIVRNIDERKIAERALKENEARLSTLISNLPGMTYLGIDDENWTMLYLNGACEKLTGYRPEQVINNKEISYLEIIHPEDRQFVRDQIDPVIKIGKHFELEYRIITAEGKTKWVWERGIHRTSRDGVIMLTEGVIDDITERVLSKQKLIESEEKYHGMIMNLMEGFYRATVDGKLTEYNTEFIKILGLDPENNYMGLELSDFWEDRTQRKKYIHKFLKHGFVKNYTVDIKRPDGTLVVVQINSRLIKDESGEPLRTEGTLLDITDRILAEESLKQSENQLRNLTAYMDIKTENEKKRIAGEIHDGLGQLLTGLKMDLQWINKKYPKESTVLKHKLTSMNNIIDSAVNDVQNLSIQLRPKMLDDLGLIETMQSESDHFEERTGISCTVYFSPESFEVEYNRSSAIYRIMMELLTNVFRHAKASEVVIKLEKKKNKCIFTVVDNGIGISLTQINSKSSFGLMSITERVKVWSGNVNIRGERNKGTTVEVIIPN